MQAIAPKISQRLNSQNTMNLQIRSEILDLGAMEKQSKRIGKGDSLFDQNFATLFLWGVGLVIGKG